MAVNVGITSGPVVIAAAAAGKVPGCVGAVGMAGKTAGLLDAAQAPLGRVTAAEAGKKEGCATAVGTGGKTAGWLRARQVLRDTTASADAAAAAAAATGKGVLHAAGMSGWRAG